MHNITKNMGCIIQCPWNILISVLIEKDYMFLIDEVRVCTLPHDGCGNLKIKPVFPICCYYCGKELQDTEKFACTLCKECGVF